MIIKDFYKSGIYRFDIESNSNNTFDVDISNVISWDIMSTKITKNELKGLAEFILEYLEQN